MKIDNHKLPKHEDVKFEGRVGDGKLTVVEINDDNRELYLELALSMYLGERCKYCLVEFKELDDLKDAVYAGYHEHGRLAHTKCWNDNNDSS